MDVAATDCAADAAAAGLAALAAPARFAVTRGFRDVPARDIEATLPCATRADATRRSRGRSRSLRGTLEAVTRMGQLVVPVRDEWAYQHQVNILLPRRDGFQPSIVLLKEPRPESWTTIAIACDERRTALREQLPRFALEQMSVVEYLACPAARMTYTWQPGAVPLRQALQLWLAGDDVYSATFTDLASRFLDSLPLFQRWLGEIGFQGAPP
jgi:hypothetical protein